MKSRLLDRKTLDSLIFDPDIESLISDLKKTPYKDEVTRANVQYSGADCVDLALRNNFTKTFVKILEFVEDKDAEKYLHVFLHRWDVQNIKTILRGKKIHATNEEIKNCLVPAGELDEITLIEVIRQPDVRAVIDMLATFEVKFAQPLTENYSRYTETGDLVILECALDKFYYTSVLSAVSGDSYNENLIRKLIRTEIDIINIKSILRLLRDGIDIDDAKQFFIDGGNEFDAEDLTRLYSLHSVEAVIKALEETPYHSLVRVHDEYARAGKISAFEKELDKLLIKKGVSSFLGDPLSIAPVVGYFWAKFNEITNIRIISKCKTADVTEEELRQELNYV